jgi:hypothetical protein
MTACETCGSPRGNTLTGCPGCGTEPPARANTAEAQTVPQQRHWDPEGPSVSAAVPESQTLTAGTANTSGAGGRQLGNRLQYARFALPAPALRASAIAGLTVAAVGVVSMFVLAAMAFVVVAPSGMHGSPPEWFRSAVIMLGLSLHGSLHIEASGGVSVLLGEISGQAGSNVTVTPLVGTAALFVVALITGRRAERTVPSSDLPRLVSASVVSGAACAVAVALLAVLAQGDIGDGAIALRLGIGPFSVLPGAFVLAALALFFGRLTVVPHVREAGGLRAWTRQTLGSWSGDVRTSVDLLTATAAVTALCLAMGVIGALVAAGGDPGPDVDSTRADAEVRAIVGVLLAGMLALPNLLVVACGTVLGGSVGAGGQAAGSSELADLGSLSNLDGGTIGILAGDAPAALYLTLLPMVCAVLFVGARSVLAAGRDASSSRRFGRVAGCFVGAWIVLLVFARVSIRVSGSVSGGDAEVGGLSASGVIGLGALSTLAGALLWSAVCVWGGAGAVRLVAPVAPGLAYRLGGQRTHEDWRRVLAVTAMDRGTAIPASAGEQWALAEHQPDPLPRPSRRDRLLVFGVAAGVIVVPLLVVGHQVMQRAFFGPAATARSYASALQHKDAKAALDQVSPSSLRGLDRTLLVDRALAQPPNRMKADSSSVDGDTATVEMSENLDGTNHSVTLTLTREGRHLGIWSAWKLKYPFSDLEIGQDAARGEAALQVNGIGAGTHSYPVFPGRYVVSSPAHGVVAAASENVTAFGDERAEATLTASLDPRVQDVAEQAVHRYLAGCAKSTEVAPEGCPFSYYSWGTVDRVHWSITTYPRIEVSLTEDGGVSILTTSYGTAHFKGASTDFFGSPSPVEEDETFDVGGTLTWDGKDPDQATFTDAGSSGFGF